jgi:hypothetical protein
METFAKIAFALLCLGFAIGFFVFPTYPNYDSYYSLLWGREVVDLGLPVFEGFRVPTEHPLAIVAGAVLSLFGDGGDRLWVALTFVAYLSLVAGLYRLGRQAFTPLVGLVAAGLLLTRFDFAFLAARGYVDIPYMALIVWAVALEGARPHRGTPVFALLTAAGLLRPEAWLLAGMYFLWMSWRATWRERAVWALWAAAGPAGWATVDYVVTGDPLFSLHYTSSSAEDLGRQRSLSEVPGALPEFLTNLVKLPVLVLSIAGLGLAAWLTPRRMLWPAVLLVTGLGTFVAVALAGLSVIERYLIVAALALLVFAAVGVAGWTMLEPGTRARRIWIGVAAVAVVYGIAFQATHLNLRRFDNELTFRGDAHDALALVLRSPAVKKALRCGPLTLPNHKLVPDSRWIADLPFDRVHSRAQETRAQLIGGPAPATKGVAIYATSRMAIFKHAFTDESDPATIQLPPDGWAPIARSEHYAAYARC